MPRASSGSGKRQPAPAAALHRDQRSENGPLVTARRLSARRSHAQLNGSARSPDFAASTLTPSPPPAPSSTLPQQPQAPTLTALPRRCDDAAIASATSSHSSSLGSSSGDASRRDSLGTHSEASSDSSHSAMAANGNVGLPDGAHRRIDVNAMKNADVHRDSGPVEPAATVVGHMPILDSLAILVFLSYMPKLPLTLIYASFASLTFVPPVSRIGWNFNFGDIFDCSQHTPSLATGLCMDFFFFLIWVFLWPPIQDQLLEFAMPVLAVSLGGGLSHRPSSSRAVSVCLTWIFLHRLLRASQDYWHHLWRYLPHAWRMHAAFSTVMPAAKAANHVTTSMTSASYDKRDTHGWIQSLLAIHILTQGIVKYIREWYLRRERFHAVLASGDTEAVRLSTVNGSSGAAPAANGGDAANEATLHGPDADTTPSTSSAHPGATSKRKKKQNAQTRLAQPLWAALASAKIVVSKELELSGWGGAGSSDKRDIHSAANASCFQHQAKQIWITYIGSDEVCFGTSHFPELDQATPPPSLANAQGSQPAVVDTSRPLYVRINNAFWQPTRMYRLDEAAEKDPRGSKWSGDIYGLRPASKYVCEFVDVHTDQVLYTIAIRTIKEPLRADGASASSSGPQSPRPRSPSSTLRTSIEASEVKLAEEKNRYKTWRKDWKLRINALKKENELVDTQLASAGSSDEKFRQKIRQHETQKAQAERETQQLAEQLKSYEAWSDLVEHKKKAERAYAAEKKMHDEAQAELREFQERLEADIKGKETENANLLARRNKVAARISKVENELATMAHAQSRGHDEAERRKQERAAWMERAAEVENNYAERLAQVVASNNKTREHLRTLAAQQRAAALQSYTAGPVVNGMGLDVSPAMVSEASIAAPFSRANPWSPALPTTAHYTTKPWAATTTTVPATASSSATAAAPAPPPPPPSSSSAGEMMLSTPGTFRPLNASAAFAPDNIRSQRTRGRSSSMLSDVSGLTQVSDDGPMSPFAGAVVRPWAPTGLSGRRNGSSGRHASGSGSGGGGGGGGGSSGSSGYGSVGDPISPA